MNNQVRHPFLEQRAGKPFTTFEKIGPFTLRESNKGNYYLYTVAVTGGIEILKQASKPGFYDICNALKHTFNEKLINKELFREYQDKCQVHFQEHPELYPKVKTEKSHTNCVIPAAVNAVKKGRRS